jgi:hypothetical protein
MWVNFVIFILFANLCSFRGETEQQPKLWTIFDDVLPVQVLAGIDSEAGKIFKHVTTKASLTFGKRVTYWMEVNTAPRLHVEAAVQMLSGYARKVLQKNEEHEELEKTIGAEWWIQKVSDQPSDISFHYDKDEAMASSQMVMRHPILSTVTYLTSHGSPTMVLNQTSPQGNDNTPLIATSGILSYPRRNRHLIFRGDLNHGVPGNLDVAIDVKADKNWGKPERLTLLINWWAKKPMEPNTIALSDEAIQSMGLPTTLNLDTRSKLEQEKEIKNNMEVARTELIISKDETAVEYALRSVTFPPHEMFNFLVPASLERCAYDLYWKEDAVWGAVSRLDLDNQIQVSALFQHPLPKVLFFHHGDKNGQEKDDVTPVALELAKRYQDKFRFFLCAYDHTCINAAEVFGIKASDIPRVAVHYTDTDEKIISDPISGWSNSESILEMYLNEILKQHSPSHGEL